MAKQVESVNHGLLDTANELMTNVISDIEAHYASSNPAEAVAAMAVPILTAENFEEMFYGADSLQPAADLFDTGLHVEHVSFNRSSYGEGLPFYATFRGKVLSTGKDFIANCGAWQTVVVAYQLVKKDWLPRDLHFHKSDRPTAAGFYPINILPWDADL